MGRYVPESSTRETEPRVSHRQDKRSATALHGARLLLICFFVFVLFEIESQ